MSSLKAETGAVLSGGRALPPRALLVDAGVVSVLLGTTVWSVWLGMRLSHLSEGHLRGAPGAGMPGPGA